MSSGGKGPSLSEVIGAAGFSITLVTGWFYVAGWVYAYAFFDSFRIPMLIAEIPREHLLVYGGLTTWKNPLASLIIAFSAAIGTALSVRYRKKIGRSLLAALLSVLILGLFALAVVAGNQTGRRDAVEQRNGDYFAYPRVLVELRDAATETEAAAEVTGGCARLLLATGDHLFLIVPRRNLPGLEIGTIMIPWRDVASTKISSIYGSCP